MAFGLSKKQLLTLAIIVFGTFVAVLNSTVVSPALPHVMAEMSVDAATAQWLTTGFTLVNAIMIPITAFLQDKFSARKLFAVSMSIFTVGSLLCAWGPNFPVLLLGRLVQAAGEGILMPLTGTVLMLTFPVERRGTAMGVFGIVLGFAPAFGPTVAGLVIDHASWHVMFLAITILGVVVTAVGALLMKDTEGMNPASTLDIASVVLSTLGFGGALYALSDIGSNGIGVVSIVVLVVGIVSLVLFFRRQLHMENPMLQVRVLANRTFAVSTIITMIIQGALMAGAILVPIYLQTYRGFSATVSGMVLMPGAIVMGLMGLVAGRLFDKRGPRLLAIVGTGILTISTLGFAILDDSTSVGFLTVLYTVRLFSLSLVNMPIGTWGLNALDNNLINHGNSVSNTFRQVAGSLGTAVIVSVSTIVTNSSVPEMGVVNGGIHGVNVAFMVATALCALGFALTVIFVRKNPSDAQASDPTNERADIITSIMKTDVFTLPTSASVHDAVQLFVDKGVSAVPLVDEEGRAAGFISDGDILRFLSTRNETLTDPITAIASTISTKGVNERFDDRLDVLMNMKVTDIATKGTIHVDIHDDLAEVCRILGSNHLKKVPVLDDGRVIGVINRSDIMKYSMRLFLDGQVDAQVIGQAVNQVDAQAVSQADVEEGVEAGGQEQTTETR